MKNIPRILVVDDDEDLRKMLSGILRIKGYEVATAETGTEAMAEAERAFVNVALIDLKLPDMSGIEVLGRIKLATPLTEAIILTVHASLDTAVEATNKGAFSCLLKPCDIDKLLRHIHRALDQQQTQQEILRLASFPGMNPNPVLEVNAAGVITYLNPVAERLFPGLAVAQPAPGALGDVAVPVAMGSDERPEVVREVRVGSATFEQSLYPVPQSDLIRIYMLDVTERKRSEMALRKSMELLQSVVEYVPGRIFWKDRDSRFLGCNTPFAKDAGYARPDELIGKTDFEMGWRDQAELYRADDQAVMESGKPKLDYEEPQTTSDGKTIWLRTSKVPLRDESKQVIGMLGLYQDITERKRSEMALRKSMELLQSVVEYVPGRIFWKDRDSRYLGCNTPFAKDAGHTRPDELIGKTDFEMGWRDQAELYRADDQAVMESGKPKLDYEEPQTTPDGKMIWLRTSKVPLRDESQQVIGMLGLYQDITERKQAEGEILKLNKALEEKVQLLLEAQDELVRKEKLAVLGQIAGNVGHELRNPLSVMSNAVYFLQTVQPDADDSVKEYLNIIKSEIAGSERIVSDLLDSVRTKPPQPERVGLQELIGQTLHKLSIPSSVTVKLDIPATLPPLRVDAMQIQQVLRNLISNGVEAMPEGGTLEISAAENRQDGTLIVSVRDSGTGIAPELLPKLFQPLFTTKARGIGLGLVVVKNLTEVNGGSVGVESAPGKGSTFSVTLPSGS